MNIHQVVVAANRSICLL